MRTTYVGFVRDHSGSMRNLATGAANDFNLMVDGVTASLDSEQTAYATVVECGSNFMGGVNTVCRNEYIKTLPKLRSYPTPGGSTPLLDSVGQAISELERNAVKAEDAFLVMVITDGHENSSKMWSASKLTAKIAALNATDKWTFVFRVPRGHKQHIARLGIPEGNIMEWEQNEQSLVQSTTATVSAVQNYFTERSKGITRSTTFYTNVANLKTEDVQKTLIDITNTVDVYWVTSKDAGRQIRDFINDKRGSYTAGQALYQLTKPESVQDYKKIVIRDKVTGKIYGGASAKQMLGLPSYGTIKLAPGAHGQYDIFVQSNSVNRKLVADTSVVYFK